MDSSIIALDDSPITVINAPHTGYNGQWLRCGVQAHFSGNVQ
jgi:hypothetical protein